MIHGRNLVGHFGRRHCSSACRPLYLASFGPACWLVSRGVMPDAVGGVFKPLIYLSYEMHSPFAEYHYPRVWWRPIGEWGELFDGSPSHQFMVSQRWVRKYSRQISRSENERRQAELTVASRNDKTSR